MLEERHGQIVRAILADVRLDAIEATIIASALIDEEQKAALWLYAEALSARRRDAMLTERDLERLVS